MKFYEFFKYEMKLLCGEILLVIIDRKKSSQKNSDSFASRQANFFKLFIFF